MTHRAVAGGMVGACALLLGAGLSLSAFTISPSLGPVTGLAQLLAPDLLEPTSYTILTGVLALWQEHEYALALLVGGFSVLFPLIKLSLLSTACVNGMGRAAHVASHLGKWSLLDVLVVAVLIVAVKGLPGGSEVRMEAGLWLFAGSVLMLMPVPWLLKASEDAQQTH